MRPDISSVEAAMPRAHTVSSSSPLAVLCTVIIPLDLLADAPLTSLAIDPRRKEERAKGLDVFPGKWRRGRVNWPEE
ncbi:hypothetical protein KM043_007730 [Ampulex compressa]|nr:hypothetical protein KM043_007730 [Ampulex compressa]